MRSRLPKDRRQPQTDSTPFFDKNADNKLVDNQQGNSFFSKPVQAKLIVGRQDDAHENEANQVASTMFTGTSISLPSQPSAPSTTAAEPDKDRAAALEGQINEAKGGGQSLPGDVKGYMEPAFNTDFSKVKVHTGTKAEALNKQINAYAFTYDNNIFYGRGQEPGVNPLTAHELTHVAQQQGGTSMSTRPVYPPAKHTQNNSAAFRKELGGFTSTDTKENIFGKQQQQQKVSRTDSPKTMRACSSSPSFSPPIGRNKTTLKGTFGNFDVEHGSHHRKGACCAVFSAFQVSPPSCDTRWVP